MPVGKFFKPFKGAIKELKKTGEGVEAGETSEREVTATVVTDDDKQLTELTIATPEGSKS
ncbi:hypothetical protein AB0B50_40010 [Streptomyces sp. NPDC041068]|uniref:hypothetical protein n=1 Tax=Streptomyces sp. NPDC041068 TaxID=3155130 RepID=UPI0033F46B33